MVTLDRYTFNRIDRRLQRLQEVATFIFESFAGFEDNIFEALQTMLTIEHVYILDLASDS